MEHCWLELFLATLEVKERKLAKAFIGIGLPGSGKTTYLRQFANDIGAVYICADDVRAELYGDSRIQNDPQKVWTEVRRRATKALMRGRDVVIDGTHAKPRDRQSTLRACRSAGWIEGIWCQAPFGVCLARNQHRDRVVPYASMKRMRNQLYRTPPSPKEGFSRISRVNTAG